MRFANAILIDDREIAEGEFDFAGFEIQFFESTLRADREFSAVRSLKVGKLDELNLGVRIAFGASAGLRLGTAAG